MTRRSSVTRPRGRGRAPAAADRPYVVVNMAMTADGKIATADRAGGAFGGPRDHAHLLALRATADAVMTGSRTVNSARINLGPGGLRYRRLRRRRGLAEFNLRVIVSGRGTVNPRAEVFRHRFSPIIVLTTVRMPPALRQRLTEQGAQVKICGRRTLNLPAALRWLRQRWGVRRLICEGGGELNDAMFRSGLVDELHLTICPLILGGRDAPTIADGQGFASLAKAPRLELQSRHRVGDELFLVFTRPGLPRSRL